MWLAPDFTLAAVTSRAEGPPGTGRHQRRDNIDIRSTGCRTGGPAIHGARARCGRRVKISKAGKLAQFLADAGELESAALRLDNN